MKREDIRSMIKALRDLDRMDGHQPFAEIVATAFKQRPAPSRRCPNCHGPLNGWMAGGNRYVIWCQLCTTFEEASAYLSKIAVEDEPDELTIDDDV